MAKQKMWLTVFLIVLCACMSVSADEWPSPQMREEFSESRSYFVRVTPGNSWGDTVGFKGAPKGTSAKAQFFRREPDMSYRPLKEIELVNPVAPVEFFVSNDGYLATLDNWHNRGYGKVVAFYSSDGNHIKDYELRDLFSEDEIRRFDRSVSSIAWHGSADYVRPDHKTLNVDVQNLGKGSGFVFEMRTGKYQYCHWQDKASTLFRCRSANEGRQWKSFRE